MSDPVPARRSASPLASALSIAGAITSQAVVFGAVLYYFGTVYTRTWYGYFGIDLGMLGLSATDLTLRSLTPTFWPVVFASLALLVLVSARQLPLIVARKTRKPRRILRIWYITILCAGAVFVAMPAITRLHRPPRWLLWLQSPIYPPASLVVGSVLLGYATMLRAAYPALLQRHVSPGRSPHRKTAHPATTVAMIALLALGFAGAVWGIGAYAVRQGVTDARLLAQAGFPNQPSILVWSVDRLGIEGKGTQCDPINVPGEKYRWVYSGMRLLARTPDTYFVIPQEWKARHDRVFAIPRTDNLRIDISVTHND